MNEEEQLLYMIESEGNCPVPSCRQCIFYNDDTICTIPTQDPMDRNVYRYNYSIKTYSEKYSIENLFKVLFK